MTGLSTLPSTREQARHVLLLLGAPTPPRLLVDVHAALFDGDLSVAALAALMREEERLFRSRPSADIPGVESDLPGVDPTPGDTGRRIAEQASVGPSPASVGSEPASLNPKWASVGSEPASLDSEWASVGAEPVSLEQKGASLDPKRASVDAERASVDAERASLHAERAPVDPERASADLDRLAGPARPPYLLCPGLNPDLTAARGLVSLSTWPVAERIVTPAVTRADHLASVARVAEFVAMRPGLCGAALLRQLAEALPGGLEALDVLNPRSLAEAARAALIDPALVNAVTADEPLRAAAAERAARLDARQQLFGVSAVPHQRGSE
jgi:hypothetical protein